MTDGRRHIDPPEDFYSRSLTEAERPHLSAARELEGVAEEIAVLRVKLQTAINKHPDDLKLLTHGIDALVRAVSAQYRLSPKARKDLADNLANVLNSLGDQLLPTGR